MSADGIVVLLVVAGALAYLVRRVVVARRKEREGCDNCGH